MPSYTVDYSINADFSTSIGHIHSIHERSTAFLTADGEIIDATIKHALYPLIDKLSTIDQNTLVDITVLSKEEFTKTFKEIKSAAKEAIAGAYTKSVGYYGANNHYYTKTCAPKQKDVDIAEIRQVYIPFWSIAISVLKHTYAILAVENSEGITVLPSKAVNVNPTSGVKAYPDRCMTCGNTFSSIKFVCADCGKITCHDHSATCKTCGKHVCNDHTVFKRRYLILKDPYCQQCAFK